MRLNKHIAFAMATTVLVSQAASAAPDSPPPPPPSMPSPTPTPTVSTPTITPVFVPPAPVMASPFLQTPNPTISPLDQRAGLSNNAFQAAPQTSTDSLSLQSNKMPQIGNSQLLAPSTPSQPNGSFSSLVLNVDFSQDDMAARLGLLKQKLDKMQASSVKDQIKVDQSEKNTALNDKLSKLQEAADKLKDASKSGTQGSAKQLKDTRLTICAEIVLIFKSFGLHDITPLVLAEANAGLLDDTAPAIQTAFNALQSKSFSQGQKAQILQELMVLLISNTMPNTPHSQSQALALAKVIQAPASTESLQSLSATIKSRENQMSSIPKDKLVVAMSQLAQQLKAAPNGPAAQLHTLTSLMLQGQDSSTAATNSYLQQVKQLQQQIFNSMASTMQTIQTMQTGAGSQY